MEPVQPEGFRGLWSQAAPDDTAIRTTAAPTSRYGELIELRMRRLPHLDRVEAAWSLESPELFDVVVVEEAVDRRDHILGWGLAGHRRFAPPERGVLQIVVAAEHEGKGAGSRLRHSLVAQLPESVTTVGCTVSDDDRRSSDVVRHWGFEVEEHSIDSTLDLSVLPTPQPAEGVTLHEVPNLAFEDRKEVEQMLLASQTNPEARVGWTFTLDKLAATVANNEIPICVIARVEGRPAGITFGTVLEKKLYIAYSGVDPALRGRGLMKLIKQQAHLSARRAGATVSKTSNEEHNRGIRRINAELGYVVQRGELRMVHRRAADPTGQD